MYLKHLHTVNDSVIHESTEGYPDINLPVVYLLKSVRHIGKVWFYP